MASTTPPTDPGAPGGPDPGDGGRVLAREAGAAERARGTARRRLEPLEREVGERRRAEVPAGLLDAAAGGDQLVLVGEVHAVVALGDDRRRGDPYVHLGRAGVEEHRDDLPCRIPADDRVVDDDDPLARHLGERVELEPDALLAQPLVGLDEGAADVAVLDQTLAEGDPERAR